MNIIDQLLREHQEKVLAQALKLSKMLGPGVYIITVEPNREKSMMTMTVEPIHDKEQLLADYEEIKIQEKKGRAI